MRTFEEYCEGLRKMRPNVYLGGKLVDRLDPVFMPGIRTIGLTFNLPLVEDQFKELGLAKSHLTGETINRFCHIHQTENDLLTKQKMVRLYCHRAGRCIQRCMGMDALNAISVVSKDIDLAHGTNYHDNFLKYLQWYQENDIVGNCAQTDVKGDRSKRPHEQKDPDLYLRVVERREDGIIVKGAKAHNTIAPYADEIIVVPTRAMTPKDKDWAVAFAVPADAEGVSLISMAHNQRERKHLKAPIGETGGAHSITVFDNVFVPWERVFMCGETEFAGPLALLFASYHRHSYTGCKPALTDIMMGTTALVAEYNGIEKASHVRDKLAELITVAELVFAAGIASAVTGKKAASGTFVPEIIYTNVGRYHAGVNIYEEFEILADIAGGLAATLPYEDDFENPDTKGLLEKYIMRNPKIPAENIHRCFRLVENLVASASGAASQVSGIHGGGSPIMEKIAIYGNYDMESRKNIAKYLAGIKNQ
ncbi:MAG: 4-hydroxyphenylacetate 3-hydroxylase family protein [Syntrophomonadaceae bacterium]|jgi:aromatic ring hydroxylase